MLEGGGQILRNSFAYSAILGFPLTVTSIRAHRQPRPGLQRQHLLGIKTAAAMCRGALAGAELGSSRASLAPGGPLRAGSYLADTATAGSCMLLAQCALPCALFASGAPGAGPGGRVVLDLRGGTDASMAPPVGYMRDVLFPTLRRCLGVDVVFQRVYRGFYPRGGGQVVVSVAPLGAGAKLPAFELVDRGDAGRATVAAFAAGRAPAAAAARMARAAAAALGEESARLGAGAPAVAEAGVEEIGADGAFGSGTGVLVTAETSTGCLLAAARPGEVGKEEEVGAAAGAELARTLASGACVDEWLQDQLVLFMALADGTSRVRTCDLTLHTRTAMAVAERLTGATFTVRCVREGVGGGSGLWEIACVGIGHAAG